MKHIRTAPPPMPVSIYQILNIKVKEPVVEEFGLSRNTCGSLRSPACGKLGATGKRVQSRTPSTWLMDIHSHVNDVRPRSSSNGHARFRLTCICLCLLSPRPFLGWCKGHPKEPKQGPNPFFDSYRFAQSGGDPRGRVGGLHFLCAPLRWLQLPQCPGGLGRGDSPLYVEAIV